MISLFFLSHLVKISFLASLVTGYSGAVTGLDGLAIFTGVGTLTSV